MVHMASCGFPQFAGYWKAAVSFSDSRKGKQEFFWGLNGEEKKEQ